MSEEKIAVIVTDVTEENRDAVLKLVMSCYLGERCKYCPKVFDTLEDLKTSVYAGYHEHGRIACEECWRKGNREATQGSEMKEDPHCGCGISKIWATGPDDPFMAACLWHDNAYTKGSAFQHMMSRLEVDRHFLRAMLAVADTWALRLRARVFYLLARLVGGQYWEGKS